MEAIKNWPVPKTVTDVRSFLGFTKHYRKFIHKYTHIVEPLNLLTAGDNAPKKKQAIKWNEDYGTAYQKLKELCCSTPILAYADYLLPFKVHTDACGLGLSTVLYQKTGSLPIPVGP